jgi:hypothetical protein
MVVEGVVEGDVTGPLVVVGAVAIAVLVIATVAVAVDEVMGTATGGVVIAGPPLTE